MSGYLNYSLPAQTTPAVPSLSGIMAVSQILNWIIASTSRWEQLSYEITISGDLCMWNLSFPLSHTLFKTANKKTEISQQKGTKADTCHVREGTFLYREYNTFVDTPSTLKSNRWHPFWRLEWVKQADWLLARWARRGWAVQHCVYGWKQSPLCGLRPAAVHQTPCPLASDDAFCRFEKLL